MLLQTIIHVLPQLWILVALGFVAGRYLNVPLEPVVKLTLYIIVPIACFGAIAKTNLSLSALGLPLIGCILASSAAFIAYFVSKIFYKDRHVNLIGMASTTGNTGYFGVPIVLALYGQEVLGYYFLTSMGILAAEVTIGYYLGSRGHHSKKEAIQRVLKLPILYGVIAGIIWSLSNTPLPAPVYTFWEKFLATYSVIGMMILGLALAQIKEFKFDMKLTSFLIGFKFILWPILAFVILLAGGMHYMSGFEPRLPLLFVIMAAVPLAGNTPAYAALTGLYPEKAAVATLISTILAIITMPITIWIFENYIAR